MKWSRVIGICICIVGFGVVAGIGIRHWCDAETEYRNSIVRTTQDIQNTNVIVRTHYGTGSGTFFNRDDRTFVWTAGHVVRDSLDDVKVSRDGKNYRKATVIRWSHPEYGIDIALLEVHGTAFPAKKLNFKDKRCKIGEPVTHVGNVYGLRHPFSVSKGNISHTDRLIFDRQHAYQISCTARYGCSGGGVFNSLTGEYVGMLVRGLRCGQTIHFVTPSTEIIKWAHSSGVSWAVDRWMPVPKKIIPLIQKFDPPTCCEPTLANPCLK